MVTGHYDTTGRTTHRADDDDDASVMLPSSTLMVTGHCDTTGRTHIELCNVARQNIN